MRIETETYPVAEGGLNNFVHKLPKSTKFSEITLKRGITDWNLYDWYLEIINGNITRKNGSIILRDKGKDEQLTWYFFDAYPVKWEGSNLSGSGNAIAAETLTLAHNGLY